MSERLVEKVLGWLFILLLLPVFIGLGFQLVGFAIAMIWRLTLAVLPGLMGSIAIVLLLGLFGLGLIARVFQHPRLRDPRAAREEAREQRASRQAVRQRAEEPAEPPPATTPDPTLNLDDDHEEED